MREERSGLVADELWVMLMYEVNREPEIRREVSQLQRCEGKGRDAVGTVKVCFDAPQEQETVRYREVLMMRGRSASGAVRKHRIQIFPENTDFTRTANTLRVQDQGRPDCDTD